MFCGGMSAGGRKKRLLIFLQIIIQLCPNKKDADADIQPQHQDHHGSQASIHIGIIAEIIKIDGKQAGEHDPPQCGKHGSGKLAFETVTADRDYGVEAGEHSDQNYQSQKGPKADGIAHKPRNHGKDLEQQPLEAGTQNQQQQTGDAGNHKKDGVAGADEPPHNVASWLGAFIDPV